MVAIDRSSYRGGGLLLLLLKNTWSRGGGSLSYPITCKPSFLLLFFLVDNHLYPRSIPEAPTEALHEQVPRPPTPSGPPTCCGGRLPASVVNKLNKLSVRSGLFKIVGEFGLRENLYYGSIFICMTLIVIVCFLVINNRGGAGLSGLISGSAAAYDGGTAKFFRF